MNTKIEELAKKHLVVENEHINSKGDRVLTIKEQDLIEFSEVIVRECCFMIENNIMYMWKPLSNLIKDHFGVTE